MLHKFGQMIFWLSVITVISPGLITAQQITSGKGNQNLLGFNRAELGANMVGSGTAAIGVAAVPLMLKALVPPEWQAEHPKEMQAITLVGTLVGGLGGFFVGQEIWRKITPSKGLAAKMRSGDMAKAASSFGAEKAAAASRSLSEKNLAGDEKKPVADEKKPAADEKTPAADEKKPAANTETKSNVPTNKEAAKSAAQGATKSTESVGSKLLDKLTDATPKLARRLSL